MRQGEGREESMGIFARKRENGAGAAVQLREGGRHPFGVLDGYVPLSQGEMELYRSIREAVPIVDAALRKLVRLAGGVKVSCRESAAQEGLDWFLQHVNTGRGQRGIQSFLDGYLDSMLTFGRAVGEIVPDRRGCAATRRTWRFGRGSRRWSLPCGDGMGTGSSGSCPGRSCCSLPPFSRRWAAPTA